MTVRLMRTTSATRAVVLMGCVGVAMAAGDNATAYYPSQSGCPGAFVDECGGGNPTNVSCSVVDPGSGFVEDLTSAFGAYDVTYAHTDQCEWGMHGALDAIHGGSAFWVSNWGTCNFGGSAHRFGTDTILVSSGLSFDSTAARFWHEGWSAAMGCEDYTCHNHTNMFEFMDGCYDWQYH
jgi:hypothetical protein